MSPGFRSVLRFARIPVDSSEPVRRKFGSRLIGIVTLRCRTLPVCRVRFATGRAPLQILPGVVAVCAMLRNALQAAFAA